MPIIEIMYMITVKHYLSISFHQILISLLKKISQKNHFSNRRLNELFYEQVQPTLNNEDLNSMMYSVENRSPFLNKKFLIFVFQFHQIY